MTKYTKKQAEGCFQRLASVMGKQAGNCWAVKDGKNVSKVGCWEFDYNPIYGGGIITEIHNEHGGIIHPLGEGRLHPYEFCRATNMIERAIQIKGE